MSKIVGRNPVFEALRANKNIEKIILAKGAKGEIIVKIKGLARARAVPWEEIERQDLDKLAPSLNHQGVLALVPVFEFVDLRDLLSSKKVNLLLALDQIQDPQNLGSIIRTCAFMGVDGVIITKHHSADLTPAALKAAAGGVEWVPLMQVVNLANTIDFLKEEGFWVFGGDAQGADALDSLDFSCPTVLVIGNEGKGLRRLIKEKCDHLAVIPQRGELNSLNASVAAGIFLYEIQRQRNSNVSQ